MCGRERGGGGRRRRVRERGRRSSSCLMQGISRSASKAVNRSSGKQERRQASVKSSGGSYGCRLQGTRGRADRASAAQGASVCAEKRIHRLQTPCRESRGRRGRVAGGEEAKQARTARLRSLMKPVGKMALVEVGNGRSRTVPGERHARRSKDARERVEGGNGKGKTRAPVSGGRFRGTGGRASMDDGGMRTSATEQTELGAGPRPLVKLRPRLPCVSAPP